MKVTVKGGGLQGALQELKILQEIVADVRPTLNAVVYPYMRMHVEENFRTLGRHGGGGGWDFSGEPKYQAYKRAILDEPWASMPLWWSPGRAQLIPSLTDPGHKDGFFRLTRNSIIFGTLHPNGEALLGTGGIGPFGERFPARDPFQMTPWQEAELKDLVEHDLGRRLKFYAPNADIKY